MRTTLCLAVCAAIVASEVRPAEACGGCFAPPPETPDQGTVVTAHRMALSVSPEQTVLWDQIRYSGSPAEFAWVLPVKPGARVELASDAWFDVLEAATSPAIYAPTLSCPGGGAFCSIGAPVAGAGCGSDDGAGEDYLSGTPVDPVTVVSHGSAGPYEAVVLSSQVPGALANWLDQNGYAVPDDVRPLIDSYVTEGFDFVALRLLPSAGIQQMVPVRIVQPGAVTTLPLRMVAAGTGARTEITLFVIGEGRYQAQGFQEVVFPDIALSWDFLAQRSNYSELRQQILDFNDGNVFFVPFAQRGALLGAINNPVVDETMRFQTGEGLRFDTVAETFAQQAFETGETANNGCVAKMRGYSEDGRKVVRACDEAGENCRALDPATELDMRQLTCDPAIGSDLPLSDLAEALVGQHPKDVWITRLEANLPRSALGSDLVLEPSKTQTGRPSALQAPDGTDAPLPCTVAGAIPLPKDNNSSRGGGTAGGGGALGALSLLLLLGLRKLGRSRLLARKAVHA